MLHIYQFVPLDLDRLTPSSPIKGNISLSTFLVTRPKLSPVQVLHVFAWWENCVVSINHASECDYYRIEHIRQTETSLLIFIRHSVTNKRLVIKLLQEYHDNRYDLSTIQDRQRCQIEALRWNRKFTPKVYIGLAGLCDLDINEERRVGIGEIIKNPTQDMLDPDTEYVLLMRQLPKSRRLDQLLERDKTNLYNNVRMVTEYVAQLHRKLSVLPVPREGKTWWGSPEQLQKKLIDNLALFDGILAEGEQRRYAAYSFLKEAIHEVFRRDQYRQHFEQRMRQNRIKRCHGDLKATNIWITQYNDRRDRRPRKSIKVLDAIDFNSTFCNIDILSDFAMFVVDIHARAQNPWLIDSMVDEYLNLTGEQDEASRFVLKYYLVEKAIVNAANNIIFDHLPDLGLAFLDVAVMHIEDLKL